MRSRVWRIQGGSARLGSGWTVRCNEDKEKEGPKAWKGLWATARGRWATAEHLNNTVVTPLEKEEREEVKPTDWLERWKEEIKSRRVTVSFFHLPSPKQAGFLSWAVSFKGTQGMSNHGGRTDLLGRAELVALLEKGDSLGELQLTVWCTSLDPGRLETKIWKSALTFLYSYSHYDESPP